MNELMEHRCFLLAGAALAAIGFHALLARPHLLRKIMALNVMGTGVFLVFVALAARSPEGPDPIPHAMVLTGIVVSVCATGLALALADRVRVLTGRMELPLAEGGAGAPGGQAAGANSETAGRETSSSPGRS